MTSVTTPEVAKKKSTSGKEHLQDSFFLGLGVTNSGPLTQSQSQAPASDGARHRTQTGGDALQSTELSQPTVPAAKKNEIETLAAASTIEMMASAAEPTCLIKNSRLSTADRNCSPKNLDLAIQPDVADRADIVADKRGSSSYASQLTPTSKAKQFPISDPTGFALSPTRKEKSSPAHQALPALVPSSSRQENSASPAEHGDENLTPDIHEHPGSSTRNIQNLATSTMTPSPASAPPFSECTVCPSCLSLQQLMASEIESLKARLAINEAKNVAACIINVNRWGLVSIKAGADQSVQCDRVESREINPGQHELNAGRVIVSRSGGGLQTGEGEVTVRYTEDCGNNGLQRKKADAGVKIPQRYGPPNMAGKSLDRTRGHYQDESTDLGEGEGYYTKARQECEGKSKRVVFDPDGLEGSPLMNLALAAQMPTAAAALPLSSFDLESTKLYSTQPPISREKKGNEPSIYQQKEPYLEVHGLTNFANANMNDLMPGQKETQDLAMVVPPPPPPPYYKSVPVPQIDQRKSHYQQEELLGQNKIQRAAPVSPQRQKYSRPHDEQLPLPHRPQIQKICADTKGFIVDKQSTAPRNAAFIYPGDRHPNASASALMQSDSPNPPTATAGYGHIVRANINGKRPMQHDGETSEDTRGAESEDIPARKKRIRNNWTAEEDALFFRIVKENDSMSDPGLVRLLVAQLAPRRTYQQVKGHLKNVRTANKL